MAPEVRRVDPDDIPAVCSLLHEGLNSRFTPEDWQGLFSPVWDHDPAELGILVEDKGSVVGFHGHVCSYRMIREQRERFVNFSSWFLRPEYRGRGLGREMVRIATENPDTTYTVFSPPPTSVDMFIELGFTPLETVRNVWRKCGGTNVEYTLDLDVIKYRVWPEEQRILLDNLPYGIEACMISAKCEDCLVLYSVGRDQKGRDCYDVLYRSNPDMFTRLAQSLANAILPDGDCVFAADRRFVDGPALEARPESLQAPRLFRSPKFSHEQIDLLYSELQLLDITLG